MKVARTWLEGLTLAERECRFERSCAASCSGLIGRCSLGATIDHVKSITG